MAPRIRAVVWLTSLSDPGRSAEATSHFLPGVWLPIEKFESAREERTRRWFTPLPGYPHAVEYRDTLEAGAPWLTLPGAPHNPGDAVDRADATERFHRVRITRP